MTKKSPRPALPEGRAPSPRKAPKTKSSGPPPIVDGEGKLSPGVPDDVKVAIASAILAYSDMEASLEWFIWDLAGLSYEDGRLLTKIDASEKISIAKALSERYGIKAPTVPANTPTMWKVMQDLATARNLIAHGIWGMHELTLPVASSFRLKGDEEDRVISEGFPIARLRSPNGPNWRLFSV
jgi:hypothetical protein